VTPDGWRSAGWRAEYLEMLSVTARRVMVETDSRVREAAKFAQLPALPWADESREAYSGFGVRQSKGVQPGQPSVDIASGAVVVPQRDAMSDIALQSSKTSLEVSSGGPPPGVSEPTSDPMRSGVAPTVAPQSKPWMERAANGRTVLRTGGVIGGPATGPMTPSGQRPMRPVGQALPIESRPAYGGPAPAIPLQVPPHRTAASERFGRTPDGRRASPASISPHSARIVAISGWPQGASALAAGGYRDASMDEYVARRTERPYPSGNDAWRVPEGVTPVIMPPPERPHDVGPGVVGIDR
jgi:hypothetical protein